MSSSTSQPATAVGINHLVLNVRDIEASHRFWTEVMGFEHCGELDPEMMTMRFYRANPTRHHDLALVQVPQPEGEPPVERWSMKARHVGVNHFAVAYPDRESWLRQLEHLQAMGVEFLVRGEHGMTHSVYIADPDGHGIEVLYELPEEVWEGDLNAALNYFKPLPRKGPEALEDDTNYQRFGAPAS